MQLARSFFRKKKKPNNNGDKAEQCAEAFLTKKGLKFIARNYHCRGGEIDLIFLDKTTYVFVEVRYRANSTHGTAAESLSEAKLRKVRLAASYWLHKHHQDTSGCRFDAVLFDEKIDYQHLTWLRAAF
ncbi:YraN family protein [Marinomonas spartinae]|uniref:YraN family protein n=1 Tax=Marinomonas spartinae TaxID=1792290 RepID=UPI0018F1C234|nr:YraN family protein [Marinomonas spartinae]MBJ7553326.1 YraN family protein [Marinomonas spartinae]